MKLAAAYCPLIVLLQKGKFTAMKSQTELGHSSLFHVARVRSQSLAQQKKAESLSTGAWAQEKAL